MTRRRSTVRRARLSLTSVERLSFILAATLYLLGLFGALGLLDIEQRVVMLLLVLGGGVAFLVTLRRLI